MSSVRSGRVFRWVLCLVGVLLALSSCAPANKALHGTWTNKDYDYQYIWNSDGSGEIYNKVPDNHIGGFRWTVDKIWTDERGNAWYQVRMNLSGYPYSEAGATLWYYLAKVDASGRSLETDAGTDGFPKLLDTATLNLRYHKIFYRR